METSKTIAIVEDDPDVAKIIEQVLGDFGFRTVWCRSASDLLRRLRTLSPDLCIIDLGLPDMDGIEAMQRVKAQSACGILILTGRAPPGRQTERIVSRTGARRSVWVPRRPGKARRWRRS